MENGKEAQISKTRRGSYLDPELSNFAEKFAFVSRVPVPLNTASNEGSYLDSRTNKSNFPFLCSDS